MYFKKCMITRYAVVNNSNTELTKIGTCRNSDILQVCAASRHRLPNIYIIFYVIPLNIYTKRDPRLSRVCGSLSGLIFPSNILIGMFGTVGITENNTKQKGLRLPA